MHVPLTKPGRHPNNSVVLHNLILKTLTTHPKDIMVAHFIDVMLLILDNQKGPESRLTRELNPRKKVSTQQCSWGQHTSPPRLNTNYTCPSIYPHGAQTMAGGPLQILVKALTFGYCPPDAFIG